MLFTQVEFFVFLIITFLLYYAPFQKQSWYSNYQIGILIIASFFFYAYNNLNLLILLVLSILINAVTSFYIVYGNPKFRKLWATTGVAINLATLAIFKYAGLFASAFSIGGNLGSFLISIPLPIGISFYTFQGISLMIDIYQEKEDVKKTMTDPSLTRHTLNTTLFISLFSQLIAGPILKATDFFGQLGPKYFKNITWHSAITNLILGYFLKAVVADNLNIFTTRISSYSTANFSKLEILTLILGYSYQIFADFAGYSLIAIGLGKLFGYSFPDNFNFPYIANSFSDFWRRWHISLSTFLRLYLYFPLGGNRKGKLRTYFNLMITMVLGGFWHGAQWGYLYWGLGHGVLLALERLFADYGLVSKNKIYQIFKQVLVFGAVTSLWFFFIFPNITDILKFNDYFFNRAPLYPLPTTMFVYVAMLSGFVVLYHQYYRLKSKINLPPLVADIGYALLLVVTLLNAGFPDNFVYFQF